MASLDGESACLRGRSRDRRVRRADGRGGPAGRRVGCVSGRGRPHRWSDGRASGRGDTSCQGIDGAGGRAVMAWEAVGRASGRGITSRDGALRRASTTRSAWSLVRDAREGGGEETPARSPDGGLGTREGGFEPMGRAVALPALRGRHRAMGGQRAGRACGRSVVSSDLTTRARGRKLPRHYVRATNGTESPRGARRPRAWTLASARARASCSPLRGSSGLDPGIPRAPS